MRKNLLLAILSLLAANAVGAEKSNTVSVKYGSFTLAFFQQPVLADGKTLPFIEGVVNAGSKDGFGVSFGSVPQTSPVFEILDDQNRVVKVLTVNDLIGKGVPVEQRVLPGTTVGQARRVENIYTVALPQGKAQVVVKAMATGDASSSDQELVVTFSLKIGAVKHAALRLSLPFSGVAHATQGGVVLMPKSGGAAIATSVFPLTHQLQVEKGNVVVTSAPVSTNESAETALLWLVMKGVPSSSGSLSTDAKTQAIDVIAANTSSVDEPRLVVVNAVNKEKFSQSDTASYTLVCANIGTGEAINVVLGNPVPKGSRYIEGSATTLGMIFKVENGNEGQSGEAQSLTWTIPRAFKPGEERIVSFKVVLD